jgi:isopropylmalate/homocitrate/citramalate synthase
VDQKIACAMSNNGGFPSQEDSIRAGNVLVSELEPGISHEIVLHDETLRDGEQMAGIAYSPEDKIELARRLMAAGVRYMSLGFPAVSEAEREVIRTVVREAPDKRGLTCLARAREEDVRAVVACEIPQVAVFIAISDLHLNYKLRISKDAAFKQMIDQIKLARSFGLHVRFGFEDASRSPLERVKRFATAALEAGAAEITLADTCGVLTPVSAYRWVTEMKAEIGGEAIALHFHNDLGMATANTIAGLAAGARMAQTTVAGIGERVGNARMEELVVALWVKYGVSVGIDLGQILQLSAHVRKLVDLPDMPNQPIVGELAFAHESGIHIGGLMGESATYEPFPPALVGTRHSVRFGKHAGLSNIRYVAAEMGIEISDDQAIQVLEETKRRGAVGGGVDEAAVRQLLASAR